ncbi:MAG: hypothetical protein G8237_04685 [Magnetococcales bacterium]|nr:hypothetical protein [Magnetococcales bacterium]
MLNGKTQPLVFQVGAREDQTVMVELADARASTLLAQPQLANPAEAESGLNPRIPGMVINAPPGTPREGSKLFNRELARGINAVASADDSGRSPYTVDPDEAVKSMIKGFGWEEDSEALVAAVNEHIGDADFAAAAQEIIDDNPNIPALKKEQLATVIATAKAANFASQSDQDAFLEELQTKAVVKAVQGAPSPDRVLELAVRASGVEPVPIGNIQDVVDAFRNAINNGQDIESAAAAGRAADANRDLSIDAAKVIAAASKKAAEQGVDVADAGTAALNMAKVLYVRDEAVTYAAGHVSIPAGQRLVVPEWLIHPDNKYPPQPLVNITGDGMPEDPTLAYDPDFNQLGGAEAAGRMLAVIAGAIDRVSSTRAELGAIQNRFEANIANLSNVVENVSSARSRIMDADIAAETANLTKLSIMQQAGTAILAQANQQPQLALQLLR